MAASDEASKANEGVQNGVNSDGARETNSVESNGKLKSANKPTVNWTDEKNTSQNGGKESLNDISNKNSKENEGQESVKATEIERQESVEAKKIERQESNEAKKIERKESIESTNDEKTPEEECLIQIQESQQTTWVPDGGWGWMVVVGGIIIHVYIGRCLLKPRSHLK